MEDENEGVKRHGKKHEKHEHPEDHHKCEEESAALKK